MVDAGAGGLGDVRTAEVLAKVVRQITTSLDLGETLQVVAQAVVDQLGFGAAVVNLVLPDDVVEVAAVAGPPEAADVLLGTRAPVESFRKIISSCEAWGDLRFLDHRHEQTAARAVAAWVSPDPPSDDPDAWHPDDMLLAPLHAPDGSLIGVLSVDMPVDGKRPDPGRRRLLEQFAAHAALAIEHSRVHTVVANSEQLFRAMFENSPIAMALTTEDGCVTRVNPAYARLLGARSDSLVGRPATELAPPGAGRPHQYEVHFTRPDGGAVWGRVNNTVLGSAAKGEQPLILTQIEDITLLRTVQARFVHAATHDQLTGLPNRGFVLERLREALDAARRGGDRVAVLFCDVDHFKEINDELGHAAGDRLLVAVGNGLSGAARSGDAVGRFGGDEFVLVAAPAMTPSAAGALAERVLRAQAPVDVGGRLVVPSLSIGVALSVSTDTADAVLAAADRALYAAKAAGRSRWCLAPDEGVPDFVGGPS